MLGSAGMIRAAIGVVLVLLGGLWVLRGLDVLGTNGETIWVPVLITGEYVAHTGMQVRRYL